MSWLYDWIVSWPPQLQPALISGLITASTTALSAAFGFGVVYFQLGRQGRNAIEQSRKNEALKLKVQIYQSVTETADKAEAAIREFSSFLTQLGFHASVDRLKDSAQFSFTEYNRLQNGAVSAVLDIMSIVEKWRIIDSKLTLFNRVISMGIDSHRDAVTKSAYLMMATLPHMGHETLWQQSDEATRNAIRNQVDAEIWHIGRLSAWMIDFKVEMQVLLLGELFSNGIVTRRDPPDPEQFCIRLDRYEEIENKLNSSPWGQRNVQLEAEAWGR
jgi:hypothetical protein